MLGFTGALPFEGKYQVHRRYLLPVNPLSDALDFWLGPFYVGVWGALSILFSFVGAFTWIYAAALWYPSREHHIGLNPIAWYVPPPGPDSGLSLAPPTMYQGGFWLLIVLFATLAFLFWLAREVEICKILQMGYHVPVTYATAFSAWFVLQIIRPLILGRWNEGFALGITAHLDWVSNVGYRYLNFYYNPFHALAIALFFFSTMLLAMHGSAILSAVSRKRSVRDVDTINVFWRDLIGYSIGEIGIHKIAFYFAIASVLLSDLCILFSGWLVQDWVSWWSFWVNLFPH